MKGRASGTTFPIPETKDDLKAKLEKALDPELVDLTDYQLA